MKNRFKISHELKPYIQRLMARTEIPFRIKKENEQLFLFTDLSGVKFHNIVQRAKCMKLTNDTGILHVTKRESRNDALVISLQQEFNTNSFVIAGEQKNTNTLHD